MKRDWDKPDLRGAFAPEPESCHAALMAAACSVKEEKQMKRASLRALAIAAIVIVSMTAVAFAAVELMGWTDFYGSGSGVGVPRGAVEEMRVADGAAWQVGPLTYTVKELMTDGHIVMSNIHITATDGSQALYCVDPWDVIGCNGENGRAYAEKLGVDPMTPYIEAARQLGLPLYCVRGILDTEEEWCDGGMEDPLWNGDGSMSYFCMLFVKDTPASEAEQHMPWRHSMAEGDALQVKFYLRAARIDPATGEETECWTEREHTAEMTVSGLLEEKTYLPEKQQSFGAFRFRQVHAQRYATGAYMYFVFEADENAAEEDAYEALYKLSILDEEGNALPGGMDMSAAMDTSAWPVVILKELQGVEALPEGVTLTDGVGSVTAR